MDKSVKTANLKQFYKKWWFWAAAMFILFGCVGTSNSMNEDNKSDIAEMSQRDEKETKNSVIFSANHPKLYNNGKDAEDFAKKYDSVVTKARDYEKDKTEIVFNIYAPQTSPKETILHEIELYPQRDLNLDEVMELAKEYLPMNVIRDHYVQEWSKKYCQKEDGARLYAQLYTPINRESEWLKNSEVEYNYVLIFTEMLDDKAKYVVLRTTNDMPNTDRNCKTEQWDYTII